MNDFSPENWNVLVVGDWNPAILTPEFISSKLLGKSPGEAVELRVNIAFPGSYQIVQPQVLISPSARAFEVSCATADEVALSAAREVAAKALDVLDRTPVRAAGFNLRYSLREGSDGFDLDALLDEMLAPVKLSVAGRFARRTLVWGDGTINLDVGSPTNSPGTLALNFHRSSADPKQLADWLRQDAEKISEIANEIRRSLGEN
ncbi:MAG: hypothetical protein U0R49_04090 [Fimbriimonadales bacterium]